MQKFDSISHFIQSGDFEYRVFDMGRKLTRIDNHDFAEIEAQKLVYPYPFQQKAWLALLIWEEGKQQDSVIWFLQFPLDELGYLKLQSRDAFLLDLLQQAGKNIQAKQKGKKVLDELAESAFAFKPSAYRLAALHAFASCELGQPASRYYSHAHSYLTGENGFEQWQFLGLQGIADVVARLDQDHNEELLIKALPQMQAEPLEYFSQFLENVSISDELFFALEERLRQEIQAEKYNMRLVSALLRGISGSRAELKECLFLELMQLPVASEIEFLAVISGRSWESLKNPALLDVFIENLAQQEQPGFNAILLDLLVIPGMREVVFAAIRNPRRSEKVSQKLGVFMQALNAGNDTI